MASFSDRLESLEAHMDGGDPPDVVAGEFATMDLSIGTSHTDPGEFARDFADRHTDLGIDRATLIAAAIEVFEAVDGGLIDDEGGE